MFKVKYVDSIMMLVRLDLNLIVSLFQHNCEVSETVSTTTLSCCTQQASHFDLDVGCCVEHGVQPAVEMGLGLIEVICGCNTKFTVIKCSEKESSLYQHCTV